MFEKIAKPSPQYAFLNSSAKPFSINNEIINWTISRGIHWFATPVAISLKYWHFAFSKAVMPKQYISRNHGMKLHYFRRVAIYIWYAYRQSREWSASWWLSINCQLPYFKSSYIDERLAIIERYRECGNIRWLFWQGITTLYCRKRAQQYDIMSFHFMIYGRWRRSTSSSDSHRNIERNDAAEDGCIISPVIFADIGQVFTFDNAFDMPPVNTARMSLTTTRL